MSELLENLKPGLLWVGADGVVRHTNRSGGRRTGVVAGQRIQDPELARAVVSVALSQIGSHLTLAASPDGEGGQPVACRVIPGLEGDDVFVLVGGQGEPEGLRQADTLMRAVRQDLRDPLRHARAALEVAQLAETSPHGPGLEMQALLDRVDSLLDVADQLVDLAHLWDGGDIATDDRIELWTLLQQVWAEVEPLAIDRQVRVRFTTDTRSNELATLYGSARWIRRVFVECLKGAVRLAPRGGELEVAHVQAGPRARIVIHDSPLFVRGTPDRGADAIGHQLCRHVLARHGGRLMEELDGERRHLVIDLPTGAPHRSDEPALAIEQAQRYARDLAALMNRARGPQRASPASTA